MEDVNNPFNQVLSLSVLIDLVTTFDIGSAMKMINGYLRVLKMLNCGNEEVVINCLLFLETAISEGDVLCDMIFNHRLLEYIKYVFDNFLGSQEVIASLSEILRLVLADHLMVKFEDILQSLWPT